MEWGQTSHSKKIKKQKQSNPPNHEDLRGTLEESFPNKVKIHVKLSSASHYCTCSQDRIIHSHSKCGPCVDSICIAWELIRNAR